MELVTTAIRRPVNRSLDDGMGLGRLLHFLDDWLARDPEQIGTSLARFIGIDGCGLEPLRGDLARFMFLLGETDGEGLFQGASRNAYVGESSRGEPPVLGIDGLLAVVAFVRRLRAVQAGADNGGGGRCLEMLPCPLEPAGSGNRAGVGGVPGGEPGAGGLSAGRAGRADGPGGGRRERG